MAAVTGRLMSVVDVSWGGLLTTWTTTGAAWCDEGACAGEKVGGVGSGVMRVAGWLVVVLCPVGLRLSLVPTRARVPVGIMAGWTDALRRHRSE